MAKAIMDALSWVYISIAISWSVILGCGLLFLYLNRNLQSLRIRRLPLVFAGVIILHGYLIICLIAYTIMPIAPCQVEFFIMSIYVPLGIALFQAANSQFLYIATQQSIFAKMDSLDDAAMIHRKRSMLKTKSGRFCSLLQRLQQLDKINRMTVYIGIGIILQVLLTVFIYLISRKFHPSFGIVPVRLQGTDEEQRAECTRGWEWWPSIFWQFFWAWIYAPWILYKSRKIKDTHGWRLQTILCCISGLPASPLWLAGLYSKKFLVVDAVFVPPMWFGVSIFFLQLFTIFIPCLNVVRDQHLQQETLDAIAAWERNNKALSIGGSDTSTTVSHMTVTTSKTLVATEYGKDMTCDGHRESMVTMTALDHALKYNPERLQAFAALKDFSGENISFLNYVTEWKQSWALAQRQSLPLASERDEIQAKVHRQQFNKAIRIYAAFVSLRFAEFPVNLSAKQIVALEEVFERSTNLLYGATGPVAGSEITPFAHPDEKDREALVATSEVNKENLVWYWGPIPANFNSNVFDGAEKEIRYLVLTNTWPKYVNQGWANTHDPNVAEKVLKYLTPFR